MGILSMFKSETKQPAGGISGATSAAIGTNSGAQANAASVQAISASAALAEKVLNTISEGVITIDTQGRIQLMNPAAGVITGYGQNGPGLNLMTILKFETMAGQEIAKDQNEIFQALSMGVAFSTKDYVLVTMQGKRVPVAVTVMAPQGELRVITLRDITKEKEEEGAQTEFISTASHEMRTPVASIEGYLGLALNPSTASIDDRARQYLEEAHKSSQHLGRLFQDLLDVTKLDDGRMKVRMVPIEAIPTVRGIVEGQAPAITAKGLKYSFGTGDAQRAGGPVLQQEVYALVDMDFLREVVNNLVENAIKYTPAGGSIWVGVRGDGDKVLINVTDSGIGISPDDLTHIFQKFYRADNSQTREIGGTGLGLYLVKQRVEAMGGKVWAESTFAAGSTFYVSLPRLTAAEYERRRQILINQQAMGATVVTQAQAPAVPASAAPANSVAK